MSIFGNPYFRHLPSTLTRVLVYHSDVDVDAPRLQFPGDSGRHSTWGRQDRTTDRGGDPRAPEVRTVARKILDCTKESVLL